MTRSSAMADKRVMLLNGPAGVGKTTVGRRLAAAALVVDARGAVDKVLAAARRRLAASRDHPLP